MSTQAAELRELDLNSVNLNPDNPRYINGKSKEFQELLDSVGGAGSRSGPGPSQERRPIHSTGRRAAAVSFVSGRQGNHPSHLLWEDE